MRHNQNRRSRGRSRKGPNPLTRSYESSGPDIKVRGTAAHVAEKYMTLARDAHSSGDPIAAENYLQHAEHYNRIVMAAQAQFQQAQPHYRDSAEESYDDDRQMNGRGRDRFDYNGEGGRSGDEDVDDRAEAGSDDDDRSYRPMPPRRDDRDRSRGPRPDRPPYQERPERPEGDRARQEVRPDDREPEGEPAAAGPAEPEVAPGSSRRRTRKPRPEAAEADAGGEGPTSDGAAALAVFRNDS